MESDSFEQLLERVSLESSAWRTSKISSSISAGCSDQSFQNQREANGQLRVSRLPTNSLLTSTDVLWKYSLIWIALWIMVVGTTPKSFSVRSHKRNLRKADPPKKPPSAYSISIVKGRLQRFRKNIDVFRIHNLIIRKLHARRKKHEHQRDEQREMLMDVFLWVAQSCTNDWHFDSKTVQETWHCNFIFGIILYPQTKMCVPVPTNVSPDPVPSSHVSPMVPVPNP